MNTFDNINVNGCVKVAAAGVWLTGQHARVWWRLSFSAANEPSTKFSQLRRRPLLELSPGWKCLLALPHSIHNKDSMLNRRLNMVSRHNCDADTKIIHNGRGDWLAFSLSPMIFKLVSLVGAFLLHGCENFADGSFAALLSLRRLEWPVTVTRTAAGTSNRQSYRWIVIESSSNIKYMSNDLRDLTSN